MKRRHPSFLALMAALALALVACGGGDTDKKTGGSGASDNNASVQPPPKPGSGQTNAPQPSCQDPSSAQEMLTLMNQARSQARNCGGVNIPAAPALRWSTKLAAAATAHSLDMAKRNYFSHDAPAPAPYGGDVTARVEHFGYAWQSVGENIAASKGNLRYSASQAMQNWLNSPGHCRNLMQTAFTEVGMGCAQSGAGRNDVYWTQNFARPR